jgi:hypothetical protein
MGIVIKKIIKLSKYENIYKLIHEISSELKIVNTKLSIELIITFS